MISLVSSQVRFRRTGSWARAFQKFVTLSILRVALMSSYTARTAGLALSYSMKPRVDMMSAPKVDCERSPESRGIATESHGIGNCYGNKQTSLQLGSRGLSALRYRFRRFRCDSGDLSRFLHVISSNLPVVLLPSRS